MSGNIALNEQHSILMHLLSGSSFTSYPDSSFGLLFSRRSCEYVHLVRRMTVLAKDETTCYEKQANYMSVCAQKLKKQAKNKQEVFFMMQKKIILSF